MEGEAGEMFTKDNGGSTSATPTDRSLGITKAARNVTDKIVPRPLLLFAVTQHNGIIYQASGIGNGVLPPRRHVISRLVIQ